MGPAVVCRAVARPQQAHYQGSVVFPSRSRPTMKNVALIFCSPKQALKARKCIPTIWSAILQQRYNHNIPPRPTDHPHLWMNAGTVYRLWNQPPAGNTFLVEFGFWGCCGFPGPAAGSRAPVRAPVVERSLAQLNVHEHGLSSILDPHSSSCLHFTFPANRRI